MARTEDIAVPINKESRIVNEQSGSTRDTVIKPSLFKQEIWQGRITRSAYLIGAVLLHLILFIMLATLIVFKAPVREADASTFLSTSIRPPPPLAPPPPAGGDALNALEPSVDVVPPATASSAITSINPASFSVKNVKIAMPNLPAFISAPPVGTGLSGHNAAGQQQGTGSPFGSFGGDGAPQMEGYLYDLKQTRDGKPTNMDVKGYHNKLTHFVAAHWDSDLLEPYYKSPKPLSASSIFIPIIHAEDGPKAFGVENEVKPNMYVVWYKVTASPPQEGNYHFVGVGDDILVVRVNGKTELDGSLFSVDDELRQKQKSMSMTGFTPTTDSDAVFWIGTSFHVSASEPVDIDILIGEEPGGFSDYFLYIQRDESTYQSQPNSSPLLPVFQLDSKPIHPIGEPMTYPPFASTPEPWRAQTP